MAINIREGRWGVSRIVQEADGGYAVAAMLQTPRLADQVSAYYPPLQNGVYPVGWALVHLVGNIGTPDADTRLLPDRLTTATVGDLTQQQRNTLRNVLEQALSAYSYVDRYGATINKAAFQAAGYSLSTPIFQILRDVFEYLGHSESRPVQAAPESHNTQYLDDFSTDPSSRWTVDNGTLTWDSGNSEYDAATNLRTHARYTANDPGSIEHEAQITLKCNSLANSSYRTPGPLVRASATNNGYTLIDNGDDVIPLHRYNNGTRAALAAVTGSTARNPSDFATLRLAASGTAGSNVALAYWQTVHGATKPSDPGWIGTDESPQWTYSDTDTTNRHDDSDDIQCGFGGRDAAADHDPQLSFWKSRAISDRGGGGPQTVSTGTAAETDTAFALSRIKIRATSQAISSNSALSVLATKLYSYSFAQSSNTAFALSVSLNVSPAEETDSSFALGRTKIYSTGQGISSNLALPAGAAVKVRSYSFASSANTAFAAARIKIRGVGLATEVDTAFALSQGLTCFTGLADSANTAFSLDRRKTKTYTFASETDVALDLAVGNPALAAGLLGPFAWRLGAVVADVISTGTAVEADTAYQLNKIKLRSVGRADEVDIALTPGIGAGLFGLFLPFALPLGVESIDYILTGRAEETDTAFALSTVFSVTTIPVRWAQETAIVSSPTFRKTKSIGLGVEVDSAYAVTYQKVVSTKVATESDSAFALTFGSTVSTGVALESDFATQLVYRRLVSVQTAVSLNEAQSLNLLPLTEIAVGTAVEVDVAFAFTLTVRRTIGLASESNTAFAMRPSRLRVIEGGVESDSALSLQRAKVLRVGFANSFNTAFDQGSFVEFLSVGVAQSTNAAKSLFLVSNPAREKDAALFFEVRQNGQVVYPTITPSTGRRMWTRFVA